MDYTETARICSRTGDVFDIVGVPANRMFKNTGNTYGGLSRDGITVTNDRTIHCDGRLLDYRIEGKEIEWSFILELVTSFRNERR